MNEESREPTSHLFTLRLWLEVLGNGKHEWRGKVKYVLTGETHYFRGWEQLQDALRRCLPGFELNSGIWLEGPDAGHLERSPHESPVPEVRSGEGEVGPEARES